MSRWDTWEYNELVDTLSDYHKDVFGVRLRMNGEPKEVIVSELDRIDTYMAHMKSTPEGRAQLKAEGWSFDD